MVILTEYRTVQQTISAAYFWVCLTQATIWVYRQTKPALFSKDKCVYHFQLDLWSIWESQNHRIEEEIRGHLIQTTAEMKVVLLWNHSRQISISLFLKTSKEGDFTVSWGSLFHLSMVLTVKKDFFLRYNLKLLCCILKRLLHFLSPWAREKSCSSFLYLKTAIMSQLGKRISS